MCYLKLILWEKKVYKGIEAIYRQKHMHEKNMYRLLGINPAEELLSSTLNVPILSHKMNNLDINIII